MEYFEGGQVDDNNYIKNHHISAAEVSKKLGELYSQMIFVQGYVHCDPHPGNILVQKDENSEVKIVLLDHGLYVVSISTYIHIYLIRFSTFFSA